MTTPLVIVGAGGFAREVHDIVEAINEIGDRETFTFLGFIDNHVENPDLLAERGPVLGGDEVLQELSRATQYVIAIGDGRIRRKIDRVAMGLGLVPAILVHPAATIGRHGVIVGPGTIVGSHASLTTAITLGRHVHINLNVTVGHDTEFGDYVTVNPGATVSGNVVLEDEVTIGTGAAIIQGVTVGAGSMIGAGAGVVRNVPPGVTAVGTPAKSIGPRL